HDFFTVAPFPAATTMHADFPEVVAQTHLIPSNMTAQVAGRQFPVTVGSVDTNFLRVIQLPLVSGNAATALAKPESLLVSQATAKKFFGTANPLGKTVVLGDGHALVVVGVLRDLPHNTHLQIDMLMPNTSKADTFPLPARQSWLNVNGPSYVKLAPGTDVAALQRKLVPMLDKNIDVK